MQLKSICVDHFGTSYSEDVLYEDNGLSRVIRPFNGFVFIPSTFKKHQITKFNMNRKHSKKQYSSKLRKN